ncbi:sugar kinase [Paenibacillus cymbidii]|uniref:sugar kinase n=1 Tax=Paenibacillus cymbidii TaxID=1639034 RepID=UPI00108188E3|nr:sugar kinase [Paenibacillus cymbidii]
MTQHTQAVQREQTPDVVTFGESMALMLPVGTKGIEYSSQFEKSLAGAESNLAIGIARLGGSVGWFGRLGKDPLGRDMMKRIRGEGVDVSRAQLSDDGPTGLIVREVVSGKSSVYYYRKFSAASRMRPEHLDADYIGGARYLHVTGITCALSAECRETVREAVRIAKRRGVKVCFDPNLRLKLWTIEEARPVLLELAAEADYFLPGLDELKLLYETENFDAIVARLQELPGVSIVKGGEDETYIVEKDGVSAVPYFKVEQVVDTVGAGDGFCAGFITGLLKQYDYKEAVRLGNLIGSMVIQMEGDWEGLPTWEQVEAKLGGKTHVER